MIFRVYGKPRVNLREKILRLKTSPLESFGIPGQISSVTSTDLSASKKKRVSELRAQSRDHLLSHFHRPPGKKKSPKSLWRGNLLSHLPGLATKKKGGRPRQSTKSLPSQNLLSHPPGLATKKRKKSGSPKNLLSHHGGSLKSWYFKGHQWYSLIFPRGWSNFT